MQELLLALGSLPKLQWLDLQGGNEGKQTPNIWEPFTRAAEEGRFRHLRTIDTSSSDSIKTWPADETTEDFFAAILDGELPCLKSLPLLKLRHCRKYCRAFSLAGRMVANGKIPHWHEGKHLVLEATRRGGGGDGGRVETDGWSEETCDGFVAFFLTLTTPPPLPPINGSYHITDHQ